MLEITDLNKTPSIEALKSEAEKLKNQLKKESQEDSKLTELKEQESLSKKLTVLNDLTLVKDQI